MSVAQAGSTGTIALGHRTHQVEARALAAYAEELLQVLPGKFWTSPRGHELGTYERSLEVEVGWQDGVSAAQVEEVLAVLQVETQMPWGSVITSTLYRLRRSSSETLWIAAYLRGVDEGVEGLESDHEVGALVDALDAHSLSGAERRRAELAQELFHAEGRYSMSQPGRSWCSTVGVAFQALGWLRGGGGELAHDLLAEVAEVER